MPNHNLIPAEAESQEEFLALEAEAESTGYIRVGTFDSLDALLEATDDYPRHELDANHFNGAYTLWVRPRD
jgi:hypothetical protein